MPNLYSHLSPPSPACFDVNHFTTPHAPATITFSQKAQEQSQLTMVQNL